MDDEGILLSLTIRRPQSLQSPGNFLPERHTPAISLAGKLADSLSDHDRRVLAMLAQKHRRDAP